MDDSKLTNLSIYSNESVSTLTSSEAPSTEKSEILNAPAVNHSTTSNIRSTSFLSRPEMIRIGPAISMRNQMCGDTPAYETLCDNIIKKRISNALPLDTWGLPAPLVKYYRDKGITDLFPWQVKALWQPGVLFEGRNIIYSAPTSAGKSMVADLLMYKTLYERKKKVIIVLPFISISNEKVESLQTVLSYTGITIDCFAGNISPIGGFSAVDVAVCTIEKANNMINRIIEENALSDIGMVIVDELHMLADPNRGYILELLLSKLMFTTKQSFSKGKQNPLQIVGMSATIPNLDHLAIWLDAAQFTTTFRPISLAHSLVKSNVIYQITKSANSEESILLPASPTVDIEELQLKAAPDDASLIYYAIETLANGFSSLVFCPTKLSTEKTARSIAENIYELGAKSAKQESINECADALGSACRANLCMTKINELLVTLFSLSIGFDQTLVKTIRFGVAFHHAGMSNEERFLIEKAFREGTIRVLCSTTTLSAGFNLPAKRVLVNGPFDFSGKILNVTTYQQMIGRAGRTGLDTTGESMLFCKEKDFKNAMNQLINASVPPIKSCLLESTKQFDSKTTHSQSQSSNASVSQVSQKSSLTFSTQNLTEKKFNILKQAIMEVIFSSNAKNCATVESYAKLTFCSVSAQLADDEKKDDEWMVTPELSFVSTVKQFKDSLSPEIETAIKKSLQSLTSEGLIDECTEMASGDTFSTTTLICASTLGKAIVASGVGLETGLLVYQELVRFNENTSLQNDEHLTYLATPPFMAQNLNIDWSLYLKVFDRLKDQHIRIAELLGVKSSVIILKQSGESNVFKSSAKEKLVVYQRFYASLALFDLIQEVPLNTIADQYKFNRGTVQSLQQNAVSFASMLRAFCDRMGTDWEATGKLVVKLKSRLTFAIHSNLVDLMQIKCLTVQIAKGLFAAGIKTLIDIIVKEYAFIKNILDEVSKSEATQTANTIYSNLGSFYSNTDQKIGQIYIPHYGKWLSTDVLTLRIVHEAKCHIAEELNESLDIDEEQSHAC